MIQHLYILYPTCCCDHVAKPFSTQQYLISSIYFVNFHLHSRVFDCTPTLLSPSYPMYDVYPPHFHLHIISYHIISYQYINSIIKRYRDSLFITKRISSWPVCLEVLSICTNLTLSPCSTLLWTIANGDRAVLQCQPPPCPYRRYYHHSYWVLLVWLVALRNPF